jgi:hypothetical protein
MVDPPLPMTGDPYNGFEKWIRMLTRKNIRSPLRTQRQHNKPPSQTRRLVSNTDRFVEGTRMANSASGHNGLMRRNNGAASRWIFPWP